MSKKATPKWTRLGKEAASVLGANIRAFMADHAQIRKGHHFEKEGIAPSTVRTYLKGNPGATLDIIAQIAGALGKKPWQLLCKDQNATVLSEATRQQLLDELNKRMRDKDN